MYPFIVDGFVSRIPSPPPQSLNPRFSFSGLLEFNLHKNNYKKAKGKLFCFGFTCFIPFWEFLNSVIPSHLAFPQLTIPFSGIFLFFFVKWMNTSLSIFFWAKVVLSEVSFERVQMFHIELVFCQMVNASFFMPSICFWHLMHTLSSSLWAKLSQYAAIL